MLQPLIPSIDRDRTLCPSVDGLCAYCGTPTSCWSYSGGCVQCHLVRHLDRPHIDAEAIVGWIPEISQAALNRIIRELHCQLHRTQAGFSARPGPHYVSRALNERVGVATKILGTSCASELAQSLALLRPATYAERYRLLGGIRIMAAGQFFVDGEDIYPQILDDWCKTADTNGAT